MEVLDAIKSRRSIRVFDPNRQLTLQQITTLLEAARWAPSAGNLQSRFFYVIKDSKTKQLLQQAALDQECVSQAAIVMVACADLERCAQYYGSRGRSLYAIQDATIATQNIWLAATDMGLGAVWIGAFAEDEVARILHLPDNLYPVAILPVGYPAESPEAPPRKPVAKISKTV